MFRIVNGNPIQQKQVFIRPAATDIQAGKSFRTPLNTWKQLDGFQDIGFTKESWSALDGGDRNFDGAHFGGRDTGFPLGGYDGLFQ